MAHGLVTDGLLPPTPDLADLRWGDIPPPGPSLHAQNALDFSETVFHMSGHFLPGETHEPEANDDGPGFILLTGVNVGGDAVERPRTGGYDFVGDGEYAGFNFRALSHDGESVLAGQYFGTYMLNTRSKYYVRRGGVSGIHQALNTSAFNGAIIYGFPIRFDHYAFSYLDNLNKDSRTDGNLEVKYPAGFNIDFAELTLTCLGALDKAEVAEPELERKLDYWAADFKALIMFFERLPAEKCDPSVGYLALGVEAYASHSAGLLRHPGL